MHRHGLSYRAVREVLEMPQDTLEYAHVLASLAARRAVEMGKA